MGGRVALLTPSVALPCSLAHPCRVASLRDMRQHYEHASALRACITCSAPFRHREHCGEPCPFRLQGSLALLTCSPLQGSVAQSYCLGGGGLGEKNLRPGHRPILRSQPFSSQPARFLPLRLSPPLPLLLCSRNAATLLFFLSALVLVNFLGMA